MGYLEPAEGTCASDAVEPHLQERLADVLDGARSALWFKPGVCLHWHRRTDSRIDRDDPAPLTGDDYPESANSIRRASRRMTCG